MKKLILYCFLGIAAHMVAQEEAWVFFKDKENVQAALENPITILSQKSIDRKNRHNTPIDDKDVPVNEYYISIVKGVNGITVLAKSKWFNCVYVRGMEADIRNLSNLSFVDSLDFADNSLDDGGVKREIVLQDIAPFKFGIGSSTKDFNYGAAEAQIQQLRADYLHNNGFSGQGMTIAVMDSGFPDVGSNVGFERARSEGRLLAGYDFVNRSDDELQGHNHGAHTFSDIAGFIDGQFVGTAPDAFYHLFITEDINTEGPKEEALWVEAAERADSLGVDVINTSLGYSNGFDNPAYEYTTADMDGQTTFISRGANMAFDKGMLVVVSAGNSGNNSWGIITAPGDAPGALTIGAVNSTGEYVSFSSRGPTADNRVKPDVVARGSGAAIINTSGSVSSSSGTSFSSPIMAGAVACLWQAFPEKNNVEIMQLIRESANQFNTPTNEIGYGIPNFENIVQILNVTSENNNQLFETYPNPVKDRLYFNTKNINNSLVSIFSLDGKKVLSTSLQGQKYMVVSTLSSGFYILRVEGRLRNYERKIVKQ